MSAVKWIGRVCASLALATIVSCGGSNSGDDFGPGPSALSAAQRLAHQAGRSVEEANFSPVTQQRLRALATRAEALPIEVPDDALDLFEFAESNYREYFPTTPPDQRFTDEYGRNFSYRFYAQTGAYLGVDDTSRVYVLGGPFGINMVFVGQVSDFLPNRCKRVSTGFDLQKLNEAPGGDSGGTDGGGTGAGSGEGAIRGADVALYNANGVRLGTAKSDGHGMVRLKACGAAGPFLIEFAGNATAQYFDEAVAVRDGEAAAWLPFAAGELLSVWVEDLNSHHVVVSPLTHAGSRLLENSSGARADRVHALAGAAIARADRPRPLARPPTVDAIRAANEMVRSAVNARFISVGLEIDDITRTPQLAFSLESLRDFDTSRRGQYGQMLATLAKSAADFNISLVRPAREMTQQLALDLGDGVIDGLARDGAVVDTRAYALAGLDRSIATNGRSRLTLDRNGQGDITVVGSSPPVLPCARGEGPCYAYGVTATLAATPADGYEFKGWFGPCDSATSRPQCRVKMSGDKHVVANFVPVQTPKVALTVDVQGTGGVVTSQPTGIACRSDCSETAALGSEVVLTATSTSSNALFAGWTGACQGQDRTCRLTMNEAKSVSATFGQAYQLILERSGSGVVSASPRGISCGEGCYAYRPGTPVMLVATPSASGIFAGWRGGGCSGRSTCTVQMTADQQVTARFQLAAQLNLRASGTGALTPSPRGESCGEGCYSYAPGSVVTVTATPLASSTFAGWSLSSCAGTGPCTLTLSATQSLIGTFRAPLELGVTFSGSGTGTVVSNPFGIDCPDSCSGRFPAGASVQLTATPTGGSVFNGWSIPECPGTGPCTVVVSVARNVQASFGGGAELSVALAGSGGGSIVSSPAGINCPGTCKAEFKTGVPVTLTATAAAGSTLAGWSEPGCTGMSCTLSLSGPRALTATFGQQGFVLNVSLAGDGSGSVTSSPSGINCGSTCNQAFDPNTTVVLTATPAVGARFTGWSGSCSGTGTCTVTLSRARSVTASFERVATYTLTVRKAGTGTGTVTSSPAGIDCGSICTADMALRTVVTLTATPTGESSFSGWTGACSGKSNPCTVTMDTARTVTATFQGPSTGVDYPILGSVTGIKTDIELGVASGGDSVIYTAANLSAGMTNFVSTIRYAVGANLSMWAWGTSESDPGFQHCKINGNYHLSSTMIAGGVTVSLVCVDTYRLQVGVNGLTGTGLEISYSYGNTGRGVTLSPGASTDSYRLPLDETTYTVSISAQPVGQTCNMSNGTGTVVAPAQNQLVTGPVIDCFSP